MVGRDGIEPPTPGFSVRALRTHLQRYQLDTRQRCSRFGGNFERSRYSFGYTPSENPILCRPAARIVSSSYAKGKPTRFRCGADGVVPPYLAREAGVRLLRPTNHFR